MEGRCIAPPESVRYSVGLLRRGENALGGRSQQFGARNGTLETDASLFAPGRYREAL